MCGFLSVTLKEGLMAGCRQLQSGILQPWLQKIHLGTYKCSRQGPALRNLTPESKKGSNVRIYFLERHHHLNGIIRFKSQVSAVVGLPQRLVVTLCKPLKFTTLAASFKHLGACRNPDVRLCPRPVKSKPLEEEFRQ